jgi:outer membrane protein assembly factor BamB
MNRKFVLPFVAAVALSLAIHFAAKADQWPNWRGPHQTGASDAKDTPVEWSKDKNIKWKIALPGKGASTPIVWDNKIALTYGANGTNVLASYDFKGKELWVAAIGNERAGKHKKATGANSSATTDGEAIFTYFKSGDLACVDWSGKVVWQHNLQDRFGEDTLWWDLGTSPVLAGDNVVVAVMHSGDSFLAAFNKTSGELAWKVDRNLGAPSEAAQSYSTPVVADINGKSTIVVVGADHATGHDAVTGKQLWISKGLNPSQNGFFRSISGPVVSDNIVVAPYARGGSVTGFAIESADGKLSAVEKWALTKGADVPTPVAKDGRVYVLSDDGAVACVDVKSGETVWQGVVKGGRRPHFSASPVVANDKFFATSEDGRTYVLKLGDKFEQLATNELDGEETYATPVPVNGKLLIRTLNHLYCIGQ